MRMKQSNLPKVIVITVALTCLFAIGICGCSTQPSGELRTKIIVTQDFGSELMLDKSVTVSNGANAMDALKQVAEVETAYGGGFVNAINGIHSQHKGNNSAKKDWFIYVNGIQTNVGALDYTLHSGDIEHWDFHSWGLHQFIPASIGAFPEPFVHGYEGKARPTVVAYEDNWEKSAEDIASNLKQLGVESISSKSIRQLSEDNRKSCNLILVGDMDCELISELNQAWKRLGFYVYFEEGKLVRLDPEGEVAAKYKAGSGLIQATQSPWNPKGIGACENVVWMVSGTDEAGVKNAVDALINHHAELQHAFAVVIADGEITNVPLPSY